MRLSSSHPAAKCLIFSLWLDLLAWCFLLHEAREHPLTFSGCLQTHDKVPLSALQSNLDCARSSSSTGFYRCLLHKQRVTGKQHIQAYFTPQSVKDVSCSFLCTVVMANEDSNTEVMVCLEWQDTGTESDCWVKIPWCACYLRSLPPIYNMKVQQTKARQITTITQNMWENVHAWQLQKRNDICEFTGLIG